MFDNSFFTQVTIANFTTVKSYKQVKCLWQSCSSL